MQKITYLAKKIADNLEADIDFRVGDSFFWDYSSRSITYNPTDPSVEYLLLHELGHALLDHREYTSDINLIKLERQAWDEAITLAGQSDLIIPTEVVENTLDSYRDWLHARSLCPNCDNTGFQATSDTYRCPNCAHQWRVNQARDCALRRYSIDKTRL